MKTLNSEQSIFFQQIAKLAFLNPFSQQREQADCALLNIDTNTLNFTTRRKNTHTLLHANLENINEFHLSDYQGKTQEQLKISWLFYQFYEYQTDFKQLIEAQLIAGDTPIKAPFTKQLVYLFQQAKFDPQDTEKYIALFYQLHRGFQFINEAITGDCPAIIELRVHLWNNIFTFNPIWYLDYLCERMEDFSTLLLGATGTGKSLIAHTIGCSGFIPFDSGKCQFKESFTRSFQSINLAQYPETLLESELFGHKKGAFTGAIDNHQGLFARCSEYGAVFIDEIGDINIPTQVKLLNVIQDRVFCPVGSHEKIRFSGRVISATNRNIHQLRKQEEFRDDLYYRLCSDVIIIPSLRQRLQENPAELSHLIKKLLRRITNIPSPELAIRIEKKIYHTVPDYYTWPGNIRELEQCIRRICLTGNYNIDIENLSYSTLTGFNIIENNAETSAQNLLQDYCRFLYQRYGSYESVARITQLDRRTVKKYIINNTFAKNHTTFS